MKNWMMKHRQHVLPTLLIGYLLYFSGMVLYCFWVNEIAFMLGMSFTFALLSVGFLKLYNPEKRQLRFWLAVVVVICFILGVQFVEVSYFGLLRFLYPLLILFAVLMPGPLWSFLLGLPLIGLALSYYGKVEEQFFWGAIIGLSINQVVYTGFSYVLNRLKVQYRKVEESEQSIRVLLQMFPEAIMIHRDGKIIYVNEQCVKQHRAKKAEELLGRQLFDFIHPQQRNQIRQKLATMENKVKPPTFNELKVVRLDGEVVYYESISMPIVFENSFAVLSVGKDITEKKQKTDELLRKSDKLALVGQMAAGIAHEIRNPLTSIRGFIQLLQKEVPEKEAIFHILLSELDRINLIVSEFLVLAKPSIVRFEEKSIATIIEQVSSLVGTQAIMNNVEINISMGQDLPLVTCEENQLKQVFINLIKNGIEAMPAGGVVTVTADLNEDGMIHIQISDHGCGIPKERIPTLGEPFFTTKEKGTGLGLMVCYKIIEAHHGTIKIESEVGKGTTIEVLLPVNVKRNWMLQDELGEFGPGRMEA